MEEQELQIGLRWSLLDANVKELKTSTLYRALESEADVDEAITGQTRNSTGVVEVKDLEV